MAYQLRTQAGTALPILERMGLALQHPLYISKCLENVAKEFKDRRAGTVERKQRLRLDWRERNGCGQVLPRRGEVASNKRSVCCGHSLRKGGAFERSDLDVGLGSSDQAIEANANGLKSLLDDVAQAVHAGGRFQFQCQVHLVALVFYQHATELANPGVGIADRRLESHRNEQVRRELENGVFRRLHREVDEHALRQQSKYAL